MTVPLFTIVPALLRVPITCTVIPASIVILEADLFTKLLLDVIEEEMVFVPLLLNAKELNVNAGSVCADVPLKLKIVPVWE